MFLNFNSLEVSWYIIEMEKRRSGFIGKRKNGLVNEFLMYKRYILGF